MQHATTAAEAPTRHAAHREHLGSWTLRITVPFVLLVLSVPPGVAAAHWGGLDHYGCHTDHKAQTYHCHLGPFAGQSFTSKDAMLRQLGATAGSWRSPAGTH